MGVDLAAQDKKTGLAVLRWSVGSVVLEHLQVEAGNIEIRSAGADAAVTGIDCPLGWPAAFTDLLLAHRAHAAGPETGRDIEARRILAFRRTDFHVHSETGRWPLSVSADLIGYPAMRAAGLLAGWTPGGKPLRRSGVNSCVAEVYPAAALSRWGLTSRGYKADPDLRRTVIDRLGSLAPWLDLGDGEELCARSDDAFDAVVAGVVAGAVQLGRTRGPAPEDLVLAEEEGWVHLPDKDFLRDPWA
ncbi:putative nuclease with RNAse H fold [Nakamurella sp. UYEF19]|uniref:DUF429 domain-containing protein n=1 Tax=Nakamurella sp. UYEF19 TaxID=1756392 RepID=UPI003390D9D3